MPRVWATICDQEMYTHRGHDQDSFAATQHHGDIWPGLLSGAMSGSVALLQLG